MTSRSIGNKINKRNKKWVFIDYHGRACPGINRSGRNYVCQFTVSNMLSTYARTYLNLQMRFIFFSALRLVYCTIVAHYLFSNGVQIQIYFWTPNLRNRAPFENSNVLLVGERIITTKRNLLWVLNSGFQVTIGIYYIITSLPSSQREFTTY